MSNAFPPPANTDIEALATVDAMSVTPTTIIPSKYTTAILTLVIVVLFGLQTAMVGGLTDVEVFQFWALVAGAIVTYLAPVLATGWSAAVKVAGAVAGAVLAAVPPIIDTANGGPGFTPEAWIAIGFAGVLALATQFGVDVRIDAAKTGILDPAVENVKVFQLDPAAYRVAHRLLPTT